MTRAHGENDNADAALEALFEDAKANPTDLPDNLFAKITADAAAMQPVPSPVAPRSQTLWSGLVAALGGWPTFGSLATAAVAGLYIGVSDPTLATNPFTAEAEVEFSDFLSNDSAFFDTEVAQ